MRKKLFRALAGLLIITGIIVFCVDPESPSFAATLLTLAMGPVLIGTGIGILSLTGGSAR